MDNPTAETPDGAAAAYMQSVRSGAVRPLVRSDVSITDIDDEMIVYDPIDGATHALNLTAGLIWELCDGTLTLDEIAREVASDFNLPVAQARADTETLIEQLFTLHLLQTPDGDTAPAAAE